MPALTRGGDAVIHGYYRYTDIFFEWHGAASVVTNTGTLKALLNHEALVHPDHPLREEGEKGIKLYNAVLEDGEIRLMFSSRQVEYLRYWLQAMGITPEPIPIPHSSYLISESSLRQVSPVVFPRAGDIKKAMKDIDKSNKRLKGTDATLKSRRVYFEQVRTFWWDKVGTWLAVDFEGWERDHSLITEFGWSSIHWPNGERTDNCGHLIVEEHKRYYNGTYVPDERDNFGFGESEVVNKAAFRERIARLLTDATRNGPVFLVFHDASQDLKYLNSPSVQAPISDLNHVLPDMAPTEGIYTVDTAELFAALEGKANKERRALERVCRLLGLEPTHLHNAGNDAVFTLQALEAMASGDPLDLQREKRWPDRTSVETKLQVPFKAWEEDSDYSDMEGLNPPPAYNPETGYLRGYEPEVYGPKEDDGVGTMKTQADEPDVTRADGAGPNDINVHAKEI